MSSRLVGYYREGAEGLVINGSFLFGLSLFLKISCLTWGETSNIAAGVGSVYYSRRWIGMASRRAALAWALDLKAT